MWKNGKQAPWLEIRMFINAFHLVICIHLRIRGFLNAGSINQNATSRCHLLVTYSHIARP